MHASSRYCILANVPLEFKCSGYGELSHCLVFYYDLDAQSFWKQVQNALRLAAVLDLAEKQRGRKIWTLWFSCYLIPNDAISTPNSIWPSKSRQLNVCDISASTIKVSGIFMGPMWLCLEFGIPKGWFSSQFLGIRMGPNFWLGRHTRTHFRRRLSPCFHSD